MNLIRKKASQIILITGLFAWSLQAAGRNTESIFPGGETVTSTQQQALKYIDSIRSVSASAHWPRIEPISFFQNVRLNISNPLSMYAGSRTNFCGYGALTYLLLHDDPLGYAKFMLALYKDGKASMGRSVFEPASIIKRTAGSLKYKGELDIRPAEQMLYLTLADHYKGYLNIFNLKYDRGDENLFWASVNYAKFNRMVEHMLHFTVHARGSDLMHPWVGNTFDLISKKMQKGIVVLYLNNRILHKKKHERIKLGIPTHFVILEQITKTNDMVTLIYWDYGHKTLLQIKPEFLHKIVFGISQCVKNTGE